MNSWESANSERIKRMEDELSTQFGMIQKGVITIEKLKQSLVEQEASHRVDMEAAIQQRDEAYRKRDLLDLQNQAILAFYRWYEDAGSWSDVSLKPEDGCRWILKPDEALEGERLSGEVDRALGALKPKEEKALRTKVALPDMRESGSEPGRESPASCYMCKGSGTRGGLPCPECSVKRESEGGA